MQNIVIRIKAIDESTCSSEYTWLGTREYCGIMIAHCKLFSTDLRKVEWDGNDEVRRTPMCIDVMERLDNES